MQLLPDTKKREPDEVLRLTHIETLLLLCSTRAGREYLREHGVYEIVRALHLVEKVDKVRETGGSKESGNRASASEVRVADKSTKRDPADDCAVS